MNSKRLLEAERIVQRRLQPHTGLALGLKTGERAEGAAAARAAFNDKELATLSWAIAAINAWNRMGIGFRAEPGKYKPPAAH